MPMPAAMASMVKTISGWELSAISPSNRLFNTTVLFIAWHTASASSQVTNVMMVVSQMSCSLMEARVAPITILVLVPRTHIGLIANV